MSIRERISPDQELSGTLLKSECLAALRLMPDNSVDSIVTDPPYELGFMNKTWDSSGIAYNVEFWTEALRVLKPGGHLLAAGGSRTYHRLACAIEDAGFDIRDSISWVYSTGFPKSLDVSKAIDKAAGAERDVVGTKKTNVGIQGGKFTAGSKTGEVNVTIPATDAAKQWQGFGTSLKPAFEPFVVATKPLASTVFSAVLILEVAECLLSLANAADLNFTSNRVDFNAALDSVPSLVGLPRATRDALCEVTAMWLSAWATTSTLSTVSSWRNILAASSGHESTSTTSIKSSTTTALRTFEFLVSRITPENTPTSATTPSGQLSPAWLAVETLCDPLSYLSNTLGLPAPASATDLLLARSLVEEGAVRHEPFVLARKPLIGTVANNVLTYGTGALNIDASRIESTDSQLSEKYASVRNAGPRNNAIYGGDARDRSEGNIEPHALGRFPANLILDGSDEVVAGFPDTGKSTGGRMDNISTTSSVYGGGKGLGQDLDADDVRGDPGYGDEGSAARFFKSVTFDDDDVQSFFYCAKASTSERDAGLEGLAEIRHSDRKSAEGVGGDNPRNRTNEAKRNFHPTIKPLALMRYLIKLVTPPGGVVLDPFLGSGTTAVAAILDGFDWIGCEMTEEYWPIIEARVAWAEEARLRTPPSLFDVSDVEQPSKPVKPTRPVTPPPSSLFDVLADAHVS